MKELQTTHLCNNVHKIVNEWEEINVHVGVLNSLLQMDNIKKTTFIYNNFLITFVKVPKVRPCRRGGGAMSPVWILTRLVLVFISACHSLLALPSLSQFGRGRLSLVAISFYVLSLLFGPCRLSEFILAGPQKFKH